MLLVLYLEWLPVLSKIKAKFSTTFLHQLHMLYYRCYDGLSGKLDTKDHGVKHEIIMPKETG